MSEHARRLTRENVDGVVGASWAIFGRSWGPLGPSWTRCTQIKRICPTRTLPVENGKTLASRCLAQLKKMCGLLGRNRRTTRLLEDELEKRKKPNDVAEAAGPGPEARAHGRPRRAPPRSCNRQGGERGRRSTSTAEGGGAGRGSASQQEVERDGVLAVWSRLETIWGRLRGQEARLHAISETHGAVSKGPGGSDWCAWDPGVVWGLIVVGSGRRCLNLLLSDRRGVEARATVAPTPPSGPSRSEESAAVVVVVV